MTPCDGAKVLTNPGAIYGSPATGGGADRIDLIHGFVTGTIVADAPPSHPLRRPGPVG